MRPRTAIGAGSVGAGLALLVVGVATFGLWLIVDAHREAEEARDAEAVALTARRGLGDDLARYRR